MADFLQDFSGLNAAAGALKGFSEAYSTAEDRRLKKMEIDSKLKTEDEARQRNALQDKLSLQKAGYGQGEDGSLQEVALTGRQTAEQRLKEFQAGAKASGMDEDGNPTGYEFNPDTLKAKESQAKIDMAKAGLGTRQERLEETKNQNAIHAGQTFENDSIMKQMKNTRLNLGRARTIMDGKTPVTAQTFAMLQQDLISAVSPGGAATEGKINREMVDTLQNKLNELQMKFGNVKDLRKEQPQVFAQLKGMMDQIDQEYGHGMAARAQDIGGSFKYSSNKKVQQTVADKTQGYADQGQGLLEPKGLVGGQGLIGGQSANPHPQDSEAVMWAKQHPQDPRSAAILKQNGL